MCVASSSIWMDCFRSRSSASVSTLLIEGRHPLLEQSIFGQARAPLCQAMS